MKAPKNTPKKTTSASSTDVQPAVVDTEKDKYRMYLRETKEKITAKENEIKSIAEQFPFDPIDVDLLKLQLNETTSLAKGQLR